MDQISDLLHKWMLESLHNRIIVNTKDGSVLVFIPAGTFTMGDGRDTDTTEHQVFISDYWISIYCVTRHQYAKFIQATNYQQIQHKALCNPILQVYKDHPVVCVDWNDANAYAQWAGCQLPTEAQWEKAARGPHELLYPWGNSWNSGYCHTRRNAVKQTTCQVHAYPHGVSGYGTYNQSGNVWEWCADWYDQDYYNLNLGVIKTDPPGPELGTQRVIRGGSWCYEDSGYFRTTYRYWHEPNYRRDSLGFRLVLPYPKP